MKPIHNLLRQRLYRTQKPLIEHPPIDLLSAFSERALGGSDITTVLQHLAHCANCREIVFLAAPLPAASELTAGMPTGENRPRSHSPGFISWPIFRWGTVAACAIIVAAAVRLHPGYRVGPPEAAIGTVANQQAPHLVVPQPSGEKTSPIASPAARNQGPPPVRRIRGQSGKAKAVPMALSVVPDDSFYRQMAVLADSANLTTRPLPNWTLAADGTLQRSLDSGISWEQIPVAGDHEFRAVAVAGRNVWLGGKSGALFHSPDAGQHWAQMKSTADRPLPDSDIIGIEFEDDLHGKLTTTSSESWATSDGGRTWEKQ